MLMQASVQSQMQLTVRTSIQQVELQFACGKRRRVPGAYLEFAERLVLPQYAELPVRLTTGSATDCYVQRACSAWLDIRCTACG